MKTGGRDVLSLLVFPLLPAPPPRPCMEHANHEKQINQGLEEEVVSMAAARGWGGEAMRGRGGRVWGVVRRGRLGRGRQLTRESGKWGGQSEREDGSGLLAEAHGSS